MWRSRMPVRCTIHSSEVSTCRASSALVRIACRQIAAGHPRTTERNVTMPLRPSALASHRRALPELSCLADLRQQFVTHHVVAEVDRGREAFGIGAAMALDDDAVEPEEDAAIGAAADPSFRAASGRRRARTDSRSGPDRPAHRGAQISRDLPRGAFRGLRARCCRQSPRSPPRRPCPCRYRRPRRSRNSRGAAGCARAECCPASRTSSRPFTSSTPILRRPTVGRSRSNRTRAIALPMTAMSTRCCASAPIVAPRSSTTISPRSVGQAPRSPAARSRAMVLAGETWPSPSARRYCRPRPRHRPRPSSPRRSPATSTTSSGRGAAPGSACRPS